MLRPGARRVVGVVATLDTKAQEALYLRSELAARGLRVRLVDVSALGDPPIELGPEDVPRQQVAEAGGASVGRLFGLRRDQVMSAMGAGAGAILRRWHEQGELAGAIGLGGNQGTAVSCIALKSLPLGLPKVVVSTVASGNMRPFIGSSDIAVVFSVCDFLGGLNPVSRGVLARAAGMLSGMIEAAFKMGYTYGPGAVGKAVALTAFGNTHPSAVYVSERLRREGFEVVAFHASGAGGSAMESLMGQGVFAGVVDLTTHELLGELFGDDIYRPVTNGRLTVAGTLGLPQVVAPGGLDYFVFGPAESIPPPYAGRRTHYHNPYNTNVRATAEELQRVGEELAKRLNAARGPVAFVYPLRGWSEVGSPGGPLWDPGANEAFRRSLLRSLQRERVRYVEVDATINEPAFAERVVQVFLELSGGRMPR